MIRICAWCGKIIGIKKPILNMSKTHGMCKACWNKQIKGGRTWISN